MSESIAGTKPDAPSAPAPTSHPTGFWFIFWGELAERCSYYGMRAILALYMSKQLGFTEADASGNMHLFIAACYFLPLAGGWLADNVLGKYWTIVGFSVPYILGHVILGVESRPFLYTALVLLAMGSGVIKPNISTLMGMTYDQQRPGQEQLRSDAFAMFYWAINLGAAASSFAMPVIRDQWGYAVAFLFPAALMVVAFGVFAAGKRFYAVETIGGPATIDPAERAERWAVLGRLGGIFLIVTFFWAIFDQSSSTWTFFADKHLDRNVFGYEVPADMIQSANPILILILLPPITYLWRVLKDRGFEMRPTDKMMVGFVLTTVTMAVMTGAGFLSNESAKPSIVWELIAYVIMTAAEICISVVGLELAFAAAPQTMKSFVTACWLLTVGLANLLLNAPVTQLYGPMAPGPYFGLLTVVLAVVTVAFYFVSQRFNVAFEKWKADTARVAYRAKPPAGA